MGWGKEKYGARYEEATPHKYSHITAWKNHARNISIVHE